MRTCKRRVNLVESWPEVFDKCEELPGAAQALVMRFVSLVCLFALFVQSLPFVHSCRRGFSFSLSKLVPAF